MNQEEEWFRARLTLLPTALWHVYQTNPTVHSLAQQWAYTERPIEDLYVQLVGDLCDVVERQNGKIRELMARAPLQGGGRFPHQNEP